MTSTGTPQRPGVITFVSQISIRSCHLFDYFLQVFAQENWEGQNAYINNYRPDTSSKEFHYEYDPQETEKPDAMDEAQKYINTTITQLFYTSNLVHDLYYRLV